MESIDNNKKQIRLKKINLNNNDTSANKKMLEMQKEIETLSMMLSNAMKNNAFDKIDKTEERLISVGCNNIITGVLADNSKSVHVTICPGEIIQLSASELRQIFRNSTTKYKELFRIGYFYFVDENEYDHFKITNRVIITDDYISDLFLKKTPVEAIIELDRITKKKTNGIIIYLLINHISSMFLNKRHLLEDWNYEHRQAIQKYFNKDFDQYSASFKILTNQINKTDSND